MDRYDLQNEIIVRCYWPIRKRWYLGRVYRAWLNRCWRCLFQPLHP